MKKNPHRRQSKFHSISNYFHTFQATNRFFVTTSRGLEDVLQEELEDISDTYNLRTKIWKGSAGCYFEAGWQGAIAANLTSMCASRVLLVLSESEVENADELYQSASQIDWTAIFAKNLSFSVSASVQDTFISNSMFVALKVKDAICDTFRKKFNDRPNVEPSHADVKIYVRLFRTQLSISVDTTGEPLSRRGYRLSTIEAPLKESVAASLLRMTGWMSLASKIWESSDPVYFEDKETRILKNQGIQGKSSEILLSPFLMDPMCGSGTFLIEAALALLHWKPNVHREHFAFLNLCPHNLLDIKKSYNNLKNKVIANEKSISELPLRIKLYCEKNGIQYSSDKISLFFGSDLLAGNVATAIECAKIAGVSKIVTFEKKDVFNAMPFASRGLLIVNPPYGERLKQDEDLRPLYQSLGDLWKQKFSFWTAWLLSSNESAIKSVGLKPTRRISVYNGAIACKFLKYDLYPKNDKHSL